MNGARAAFAGMPCGVACWGAFVLAVAFVLAATRASSATRSAVVPPVCRIDLSTAPVGELALLPEVGPQLAARIAADRAVRGAFASVDDLARVAGIGERKIAELRESARATQP
jgi:DNA uptake protein ComE-like DNA-binding protein